MEMWGHGAYPLHFMPSQCINIGNNRPTRKRRGGRGHAVHMQAVVVMMVAVWARGLWSSKTSRKAVKTKTFPWFCIVVRRKGSLSTLRLRLTPFRLLLSCWSFWILTSPTALHTVLLKLYNLTSQMRSIVIQYIPLFHRSGYWSITVLTKYLKK